MKDDRITQLRKRVQNAPTSPGVYRWLDAHGDVLYIGKAKNVKARLGSYVTEEPSNTNAGPWKLSLMRHIADFDITVTMSELEALILETNMIKEVKPKYNVLMKDDKNYVYVRVTQQEYPDVSVVRRMEDDDAKYFGPYLRAYEIKRTLDMLHEVFGFRACVSSVESLNRGKKPVRGCLEQQIGQCNGLCIGAITKDAYRASVQQMIRFLKGDRAPAVKTLMEIMQKAASEKKFEKAGKLRDTLLYIQSLSTQQVVSDTSRENTDAIGITLRQGKTQVVILRERGGKLIDERSFAVAGQADSIAPVISELIPQYYSVETDIPDLILIQEPISDRDVLMDWLRKTRGKKTEIRAPERGKKSKLLTMAERNAEQKIEQQFAKWEAAEKNRETALSELKEILKLPEVPKRIEGYDISHLGGTETVGSMVVIKNGKAVHKEYRSFTLRTVKAGEIDDYKAMNEVLKRRLRYISNEQEHWKEQGIIIGKARKSEEDTMKEIIKKYPGTLEPETVDYKDFIVARKDNETIVGFVAIVKNHKDLLELDPLWVDTTYRGGKLGQYLCRFILKKQQKKVYLICKPYLEQYYAELGFRNVQRGPEILHKKIQDFVDRYPNQEAEIIMMTEPKDQKEDSSLTSTPDLLVIDGGKGQLNAVTAVLKALQMSIPAIGLAKREEEVFIPGESLPIDLPRNSQAGFLLQRLRDEAHRFANAHREKRMHTSMIGSALDEVPGIGEKTKADLLRTFGSLNDIKNASDAELLTVLTDGQLRALRRCLH